MPVLLAAVIRQQAHTPRHTPCERPRVAGLLPKGTDRVTGCRDRILFYSLPNFSFLCTSKKQHNPLETTWKTQYGVKENSALHSPGLTGAVSSVVAPSHSPATVKNEFQGHSWLWGRKTWVLHLRSRSGGQGQAGAICVLIAGHRDPGLGGLMKRH